ncbi:hypothetical protein F511_22712 [Dorcoceras hygrometricum]|uniref:Uncharacterized protein n=1 Tax=Dorcoceras hygrometricum TaxID=472368 RepID=A0A2Z7C569_9LAMI|nr:hypothetical protein F511_22712 [Dorcoceras hygrometricum]
MGNCQAIDNASLIIQHPSGRVHHLFSPATAGEIMKMNPGHYVALLLTTTLYSSAAAAEKDYASRVKNSSVPLRVTRIKLLRATDTLALGHVYRLVTAQEVMKGLGEKKLEKMKQDQKQSSDFDAVVRMTHGEKTKQVPEVYCPEDQTWPYPVTGDPTVRCSRTDFPRKDLRPPDMMSADRMGKIRLP